MVAVVHSESLLDHEGSEHLSPETTLVPTLVPSSYGIHSKMNGGLQSVEAMKEDIKMRSAADAIEEDIDSKDSVDFADNNGHLDVDEDDEEVLQIADEAPVESGYTDGQVGYLLIDLLILIYCV